MSKLIFVLTMMLFAPSVLAGSSVRLSTPVEGVVKEVYVQTGQRVKQGDKLLALDNIRHQARLMEIEAGLLRLRPEAEDAGRELKRAEELYARGVSATTELDAAKLRHARATASLKEAEARRMIAQKNLDDTVLRAPFDGVVKQRGAEPGMLVSIECTPPVLIILAR
jgi:RND family efflux transporter MFP subunit